MTIADMVHIIDDDEAMRSSLRRIVEAQDFACRTYPTAGAFLAEAEDTSGCVVVDVQLPDMDGLQLLDAMRERMIDFPVLVITGYADVELAVRAMKAGAVDFLSKPFTTGTFIEKVQSCLVVERMRASRRQRQRDAVSRLRTLSGREEQILRLVLEGKQNKAIAWDLSISIKTVEVHRARVMEKTRTGSVVELARLWEVAGNEPVDDPERSAVVFAPAIRVDPNWRAATDTATLAGTQQAKAGRWR